MTLVLSVVASGKGKGIDIKIVEFLNNAKLSGIWTNISDIHRSALTRARKKLDWTIFEAIFKKSVSMAYNFLPVNDHSVLWHGKKVFAVDGSKFDLPATKAIREEFDPESGLEYEGKGHYPQCLVTTVYDVFRRIPVARSVAGLKSSEREEFKTLLPQIPKDSVLLFDRGYPSYEMIHCLNNNYNGNFIFRCPATSTFPAVHEFIKSNKTEEIIQILPSDKFVKKTPYTQRKSLEAIKIRAIRLVSPDGVVSVLLTNFFNFENIKACDVIKLYFRRWEVEEYYRYEKTLLEVEQFHSKTPNGIRQELFASMIITVIARTMMCLSAEFAESRKGAPQFRNAVNVLAFQAMMFVPDNPEKAMLIFRQSLVMIAIKRYYKPNKPRVSSPRVSKKPVNKWSIAKRSKTICA